MNTIVELVDGHRLNPRVIGDWQDEFATITFTDGGTDDNSTNEVTITGLDRQQLESLIVVATKLIEEDIAYQQDTNPYNLLPGEELCVPTE